MLGRLKVTKSPLFFIVAAQVIATVFAAAACWFFSPVAAISALLAGAVCIVPGLYVLAVSLRSIPAGSSGLGLAIRGELGKLLLTAALMVLVFLGFESLSVATFFATLILMQVCVAVGPVIEAQRLLRR